MIYIAQRLVESLTDGQVYLCVCSESYAITGHAGFSKNTVASDCRCCSKLPSHEPGADGSCSLVFCDHECFLFILVLRLPSLFMQGHAVSWSQTVAPTLMSRR